MKMQAKIFVIFLYLILISQPMGIVKGSDKTLPLTLARVGFTPRERTDWEYYQKSGHRSATWDPLVEAGFGAFDSSNFNASLSFLERAKTLGCKDGLVLFKMASFKELNGNFQEAIRVLKQAEPLLKKQYPKHQSSLELSEHLGGLYFQMGLYDEAFAQFLDAIQHQGENFSRLFLVGQIQRMKKNTQEAIIYFEKALTYETLKSSPANMKLLAQIELIKLYFDAKDYDKSLEMANQVLTIEPMNPTALSYRDQITQRKYKQKERDVMKKIVEGQ